MKNIFAKITAILVVGTGSVIPARADTILANTGGLGGTTTGYVGESFTTPSDFLYYNLTFNFFANAPATTPTAGGTAFILNQPYAGLPSGLGVTAPGFLAESLGVTNGTYAFNPGFILMTNTTYYLYENAPLTFSYGGSAAGGNIYYTAGAGNNFIASPTQAANFSLNGTKVGVPLPEPSSQTSLYVLSGVVGLGFVVMRRRRLVA